MVSDRAGYPDPHKFAVEASQPPLDYPFGNARLARVSTWPALRHLSMYSLRIATAGHARAALASGDGGAWLRRAGRARMSILDPDGSVDTYLLEPGDVYFVPRAYPHQIEVIGDEDIHFRIFFDQHTPGDIGYRASASAFSPRVLASVFGVSVDDLPAFPFTPVDPLIVARRNPLDPVDGD